MGKITFIKGEGGTGRPIDGKDHYAGFVFYSDTKPTGFAADDIKVVNSLADAETLGITSGHADNLVKVIHYHLKHFFAVYEVLGIAPQLWVGIFDVPVGAYDFAETETLQSFAEGGIRNIGVFVTEDITTTLITALQSKLTALENSYKPCSSIFAMDCTGVEDWANANDLRALTAPKVTVTIGEDGGNEGAAIISDNALAHSVTDLGSALGWASSKNVAWNLGWVEKFNVAFNNEFDIPALADGTLVKDAESKLASLETKGYMFLRKHIGNSGTYFNDAPTCIAITSDYAYLENNQVIDKAIRNIRANVLPALNSPIDVNASTGKIDITTASFLENLAKKPIKDMVNAMELNGGSAYVNPEQLVLQTSQIVFVVKLVPKGVGRELVFKIQFSLTE